MRFSPAQKKLFDMLPAEFLVEVEYKGDVPVGTTIQNLDGIELFKLTANQERSWHRLKWDERVARVSVIAMSITTSDGNFLSKYAKCWKSYKPGVVVQNGIY